MSKALVVFSGGLDSTVALLKAQAKHETVYALTVNYGQRNAEQEISAASDITTLLGIQHHEVLDVGRIMQSTSPLVDHKAKVPEYKHFAELPGGIDPTFIPARNIVLLSLAANRAYVNKCQAVYIGVGADAAEGYPDCRDDFIMSMERSIKAGLGKKLLLVAPLIYLHPHEIISAGLEFEHGEAAIARSYTCYNGTVPPCGKCSACIARAKGFSDLHRVDPALVQYASAAE